MLYGKGRSCSRVLPLAPKATPCAQQHVCEQALVRLGSLFPIPQLVGTCSVRDKSSLWGSGGPMGGIECDGCVCVGVSIVASVQDGGSHGQSTHGIGRLGRRLREHTSHWVLHGGGGTQAMVLTNASLPAVAGRGGGASIAMHAARQSGVGRHWRASLGAAWAG